MGDEFAHDGHLERAGISLSDIERALERELGVARARVVCSRKHLHADILTIEITPGPAGASDRASQGLSEDARAICERDGMSPATAQRVLAAHDGLRARLAKVEAYARSLMGDADDSCMSGDIGQGLLDLLAQQ